MLKNSVYLLIILASLLQNAAFAQLYSTNVIVGAERISEYLPLIKNKHVAIVANQTSMVGNSHLVDTLLALGVDVRKIFGPEHGFRGQADAGEKIKNNRDAITGLPIVSLYGSNRKPTEYQLIDVDVVLFDIQDVGVRYYTYISTMHYVMQACAELGKEFIVLDRPNPNGFYIDGPILSPEFQSFVGMHPIPLVHGCTVGEIAKMIVGEGWLGDSLNLDVQVIPCENYWHGTYYELPIKPSPNLPNMRSIYLYPSLGLFEGTVASVGRGTPEPFQMFGFPKMLGFDTTFVPVSTPGAKYPPYKDELCQGISLLKYSPNKIRLYQGINLLYLKQAYEGCPNKEDFFLKNGFFNLLAGTDQLKKQIISGASITEIQQSWKPGLIEFNTIRTKYLLYKDVEMRNLK